jgi:hypothetical protein
MIHSMENNIHRYTAGTVTRYRMEYGIVWKNRMEYIPYDVVLRTVAVAENNCMETEYGHMDHGEQSYGIPF